MDSFVACEQCESVNRVNLETAEAKTPICAKCKAKLPISGGVVTVNDRTFAALTSGSPIPVVVDFWAAWCGPCKSFAPTFSEVARELGGKFVFAKLDTDANPQSPARYNIRGIPSLVAFLKGRELARSSGAMPPPVFKNWLAGLSS
ncbi:MAG: thioredoxin fold domain-containing protein [Bdellovibrionaceae bacterium]|nr:thioredoxin fold domain-containing protein [Bdellovibrionales bacterium]MCB9254133.1 thioredoxin fold domain-containing protein [Pseudobdellovibrionaceae bacterium]